MQEIDLDFYIQAIVAMFVITGIPDPVKIIFFNSAVERQEISHRAGAARVATYVFVILAIASLIGREFLEAFGINLSVFGAVGGVVIAGMGFEMLYRGVPSKAQGEQKREEGPDEDDALLVPLAIPLIAGPGAITTSVTITSQSDSWEVVLVALVAAAAMALLAFVVFSWLGKVIGRAQDKTMQIVVRIGGLLLATIGAQMMLGGLKEFFTA